MENENVTRTHADYDAKLEDWQLIRDVLDGQRELIKSRERYVQKLLGEDDTFYKRRVERAVFYEATGATLSTWLGALFRKPPARVLPDEVTLHLANINLQGTPYACFQQEVVREQLALSRIGVLQDWSDKLKRPKWLRFKAEQIINWSEAVDEDGNKYTDQIVLAESTTRRSATGYGVEAVQQWRVLELNEDGEYQVRILQQEPGGTGIVEVLNYVPQINNGAPEREIPFEVFGSCFLGLCPQKSTLLPVAHLNLDHWRLNIDLKHALKFAIPTMFTIGAGTNDDGSPRLFTIGHSQSHDLPIGGDAKFVEPQGKMLAEIRAEIASDEQRMALIGSRVLSAPKREAETAEALRIQAGAEASSLRTVGNTASEGFTRLWKRHCRWMGLGNLDAISERINTDFAESRLDSGEVSTQLAMVQTGRLSQETFLENLCEGEWIRHKADEEQQRLDAEGAEAMRRQQQARDGGEMEDEDEETQQAA